MYIHHLIIVVSTGHLFEDGIFVDSRGAIDYSLH
jgi:hypothetical protein